MGHASLRVTCAPRSHKMRFSNIDNKKISRFLYVPFAVLTRFLHISDAHSLYAAKTLETIALSDLLNQEGRNKCKDLIEVTDANYLPTATEETVTDVVLVDGKIVVSPTVTKKTVHFTPTGSNKRGPKKKAG